MADLAGELKAAWANLEEYAARLALVIHFARWAANDQNDPTLESEGKVDSTSMMAPKVNSNDHEAFVDDADDGYLWPSVPGQEADAVDKLGLTMSGPPTQIAATGTCDTAIGRGPSAQRQAQHANQCYRMQRKTTMLRKKGVRKNRLSH